MAKMKVRRGKVYKGSKPKKVKSSSGSSPLKKALNKWDKKYDILK